MSYGLETGGRLLGGLLGGAGGALQRGGQYGLAGAAVGGAGGAMVGAVAGAPLPPVEPLTVGGGAAIGALGGGAIGGVYGAGKGFIEGIPAGADRGAEIGKSLSDRLDALIAQMTTAQATPTRKQVVERDLTQACATCGCAALANPPAVPGSPYRGGAHVFMQQPGLESHHMPPDMASPLPKDMGPAIQMDERDHYGTPSFGRNRFTPFMRSQGQLANTGQFMAAFAIDAAAVRARFPGKYDAAIAQAMAYGSCLQASGLVR